MLNLKKKQPCPVFLFCLVLFFWSQIYIYHSGRLEQVRPFKMSCKWLQLGPWNLLQCGQKKHQVATERLWRSKRTTDANKHDSHLCKKRSTAFFSAIAINNRVDWVKHEEEPSVFYLVLTWECVQFCCLPKCVFDVIVSCQNMFEQTPLKIGLKDLSDNGPATISFTCPLTLIQSPYVKRKEKNVC